MKQGLAGWWRKSVAKPWLSGNKRVSGWRDISGWKDKGNIFGGGWKRARRPLMKEGGWQCRCVAKPWLSGMVGHGEQSVRHPAHTSIVMQSGKCKHKYK